jgi:hypothetical protein
VGKAGVKESVAEEMRPIEKKPSTPLGKTPRGWHLRRWSDPTRRMVKGIKVLTQLQDFALRRALRNPACTGH